MALLNILFTRPPWSHGCPRCGIQVVEAVRQDRVHMFMDANPDPIGQFMLAWGRGDNGETLVHPPHWGEEDPHESLLGRKLDGLPLYSVHRCLKGGTRPEPASGLPSR